MRVVIAQCSVDYVGRLAAHLPIATRLILVKADGSVSIHADDRAYKPLNWMTPPCTLTEYTADTLPEDLSVAVDVRSIEAGFTAIDPTDGSAVVADQAVVNLEPAEELADEEVVDLEPAEELASPIVWEVKNPKGERLLISLYDIIADHEYDLGEDPGLTKDGVEAHLQQLLAEHPETLGAGLELIRREYPTPIGPVDLLLRHPLGGTVAVEVKRRGGIDGVEQLSRYVELLSRDELLAPVRGYFAAQEIKPQAKTLAADRDITCFTLDYDELRGIPTDDLRLF